MVLSKPGITPTPYTETKKHDQDHSREKDFRISTYLKKIISGKKQDTLSQSCFIFISEDIHNLNNLDTLIIMGNEHSSPSSHNVVLPSSANKTSPIMLDLDVDASFEYRRRMAKDLSNNSRSSSSSDSTDQDLNTSIIKSNDTDDLDEDSIGRNSTSSL